MEYYGVILRDLSSSLTDREVLYEIDIISGAKYCVTRKRLLSRAKYDIIGAFFRANHEAGIVEEGNRRVPRETFAAEGIMACGP